MVQASDLRGGVIDVLDVSCGPCQSICLLRGRGSFVIGVVVDDLDAIDDEGQNLDLAIIDPLVGQGYCFIDNDTVDMVVLLFCSYSL